MAALVVPHDPRWAAAFAQEAAALRAACGAVLAGLHHIGSTAVPGLPAKPVIDLLGEVSALALLDPLVPALAALGYRDKGENGIAGRRYFQKRHPDGAHSHHLHVFASGSAEAARHLALRDYLIAHPHEAARYARGKAAILASGVADRPVYQQAKAPLVQELTSLAMAWQINR